MLNRTNFFHAIYALVFMSIIGILTGNWWAGAAFGSAFFIGREHSQAEDRWIKEFGEGKRSNMPEFGGLDPKVWKKIDPWMDWVVPAVFCIGLAVLMVNL